MDERFAVTSVDRKVTRVITRWGELRTLTWSEFEQLFAQLQSAASRSGWARAVIDNNRGYWGPGSDQNLALAYRLAEDIYDHYFPNSMVLMGRRRDIRAFRRNIRNNRFTRSEQYGVREGQQQQFAAIIERYIFEGQQTAYRRNNNGLNPSSEQVERYRAIARSRARRSITGIIQAARAGGLAVADFFNSLLGPFGR
jgi:hypothetical protein